MFRYFRRNQKVIIVVGGVILMFVFLIGDSLQYLMGGDETVSQQSPNATFATWDGGKLTYGQYSAEYEKRRILNEFIRSVVVMGEQKALARGIEEPLLSVEPIGLIDSREGENIRAQIVSDKMLAEIARKRGMSVSREALQSYIAKLGFGELSSDDLTSLLSLISKKRVSGEYILDALEEQFLVKMMLGIYGLESNAFLGIEMPYDRWQSWRAVNDLASVEAAALKVDDYRSDVTAPTDEQLQSLYDEFKNVEPRPVNVDGVPLPNPNPAFAIPRKIKLHYLHVNYDDAIERLKAEITDEEIAEYYETHKDLYIKAAPLFDSLEEETPAEEGTPAEETPAEESPPDGGEVPEGEPSVSQPPTEGEPTSEPPATSEESPLGENPASDDASTPEVEPAEPTPPSPDEEDREEAAAPEGANFARNKVHFVSLQEEGTQEATGDETQPADPAAEQPSGEQPASEESAAGGANSDTPSDDESGSPDVGTQEETSASETPADEIPGDEAPAGETEEGPTEESDTFQLEYEPLEKVADDVRKRIAEERYAAQTDERFSQIMARLRTMSREYRTKLFAAESQGEPAPKPPAELTDLTQLAQEFGVAYETTVDLDLFEMMETEVGQAMNKDGRSVTDLMFSGQADLYQPVEVSLGGGKFGDRFIVMKIGDTPRRVPSFDEIKSQVRDAWTKREAAKIALKRAEDFASKASEAGQSLKDFFDGNERVEVVETNSFSRYTQGEAATATTPSYKLAQPADLKNVGPEFMDKVFSLESGEVGAALNFDETIAYVIRIANPIETEESLQSSFLASANAWEGRGVFQYATAQERSRLIQAKLAERFNLEFTEDETEREEAP